MKKTIIVILALCFNMPVMACMLHDPVGTMHQWMDEEIQTSKSPHLYATLATVTKDNKPASRVIQFSWDDVTGITFHTHSNTQKVEDLAKNNFVSLNPWLSKTRKQITVNGKAVPLDKVMLEKTWTTMPRWMQLRFLASDHESEVQNPLNLQKKYKALKKQYSDTIPMPETFVGYRIEPEQITFYALKTPDFAEKYVANFTGKSWMVAQYEP